MSLRPFGSFLFGDGWNYLGGIFVSEIVAQPLEVTVSAADKPLHLDRGDFKFQEGSGSNAKKSSNALPLRTESQKIYLLTRQCISFPYHFSWIFTHLKVLTNSGSVKLN